jgi:NAD(P)-dependent dehydrogenase (short-subunit alcohol dehydrogenase family)
MPTWLITGCSSGIGREIAKAVLAKGWNAVITARDPATVADLGRNHESAALVQKLDVTDAAQIAAAVTAAEQKFGGIDVLVNNAGYSYRAAVEEGDDAEVRRMFETNLFGLVNMTKAVLPSMRARRSGHIINISSVAGRLSAAGTSYYAASKFAVNGLSDGLAKEVGPLGIKVTIIEPGPFRTDFGGRSIRDPANPIADYAETAGKTRAFFSSRHGKQDGDPARAAQAIIKIAEMDKPPLHLLLGAAALTGVRTELETRLRELEEWADTTKAADFPPGS